MAGLDANITEVSSIKTEVPQITIDMIPAEMVNKILAEDNKGKFSRLEIGVLAYIAGIMSLPIILLISVCADDLREIPKLKKSIITKHNTPDPYDILPGGQYAIIDGVNHTPRLERITNGNPSIQEYRDLLAADRLPGVADAQDANPKK